MKVDNIAIKGVSRQVPDNVAAPGELAVAVNVVNDGAGVLNGEDTQVLYALDDGERLVGYHKGDGYEHHLLLDDNSLEWLDAEGAEHERHALVTLSGELRSLETIGNTVVYCDDGGLGYLLWRKEDGGSYDDLGRKPPMPRIQFGLKSEWQCYPPSDIKPMTMAQLEFDLESMRELDRHQFLWSKIHDASVGAHRIVPHPTEETVAPAGSGEPPFYYGDVASINLESVYKSGSAANTEQSIDLLSEYALGYVGNLVDSAHKEGKFVMPFFVRVCYELYDGTQWMHGYPVLMIPNSTAPQFLLDEASDYGSTSDGFTLGAGKDDDTKHGYMSAGGRAYAWVSSLDARWLMTAAEKTELAKWKDIISGIGVYITKPIYTYDQDGKVWGWEPLMDGEGNVKDSALAHDLNVGALGGGIPIPGLSHYKERVPDDVRADGWLPPHDPNSETEKDATFGDANYRACYRLLIPERKESELRNELVRMGTFYQLKVIALKDINQDIKLGTKDTLPLITSCQMMGGYDGSLDMMRPEATMVYNQRLLAGGLSTKKHGVLDPRTMVAMEGIDYMNNYQAITGSVTARIGFKDGGKLWLSDEFTYMNHVPRWLWHPSGDVSESLVVLSNNDFTLPMETHVSLGGKYHFDGFGTQTHTGTVSPLSRTGDTPDWEHELGMCRYTAAQNPFAFPVDNAVHVTNSEIRAFGSATKAISEGQFGQHPVYAFTGDGVWMLGVGGDGGFASATPTNRDVLKAGTKPLSIDDAVVFVTDRGVVMMSGGRTKVVSLALDDGRAWMVPSIERECDALLGDEDTLKDIIADTLLHGPSDAAKLLYDYAHSRVYVTPADAAFSWVLNLKSGVWTQSEIVVADAVNAYPGTLFVRDGDVVTMSDDLMERWAIVTRPMVLAGGSLQVLRHAQCEGIVPGNMCVSLYGTRNWQSNALSCSAYGHRMSRLGGSPYKGHTVAAVGSGELHLTSLRVAWELAFGDKIR